MRKDKNMNDYITLKKREILKIGIKDENGNVKLDEKGNEVYIEFDLEDINTPDNYSKCVYLVQKASNLLKDKILVINKQSDSKGKGLMTKNEEEKTKAMKEFYKSMEEAMDLFLGKGGTNKIFGEKRYLTMFDDLTEMLEPIMPKLKINLSSIEKKIKTKYGNQNDTVLKNE